MKTLTPAYGHDYTSAQETIAAYHAGQDFLLQDITSRYDGKPCSCRDFPNERIKLRYNRLRRAVLTTSFAGEGDSKGDSKGGSK